MLPCNRPSACIELGDCLRGKRAVALQSRSGKRPGYLRRGTRRLLGNDAVISVAATCRGDATIPLQPRGNWRDSSSQRGRDDYSATERRLASRQFAQGGARLLVCNRSVVSAAAVDEGNVNTALQSHDDQRRGSSPGPRDYWSAIARWVNVAAVCEGNATVALQPRGGGRDRD